MNDTSRVADLLDRVSSHDERLRFWFAPEITGMTGRMVLRGRLYPWTKLIGKPALAGARQRLEEAYARQREIARTALAGLP